MTVAAVIAAVLLLAAITAEAAPRAYIFASITGGIWYEGELASGAKEPNIELVSGGRVNIYWDGVETFPETFIAGQIAGDGFLMVGHAKVPVHVKVEIVRQGGRHELRRAN